MKYFPFSNRIFGILLLIFLSISGLSAEMLEPASIKGCVIEKSSGNPLEFATVIVKNKKNSVINQSVTDKNGWFVFKGIPMGEYNISYSFIGFEKIEAVPVSKVLIIK